MIKEEERELLLSKINIVDLISEYVDLTKSGSGYKGFSPFKEEKTPSFMVSPTKKIFKDFSTNQGGNAIKFYMLINNVNYVEAVIALAQKYDVKLSGITKKNNIYDRKYEIMRKATEYYNKNIYNSKEALSYLEQRAYNVEDIKRFKLGYASNSWDSLYKELKKQNYTDEELLDLGLIGKNESNMIYDIFRNRIIFPIFNEHFHIVAFGGRDITSNNEIAKYLNSKETKIFSKSNELFGVYEAISKIKEYGSCILVEGFFDVLTMQKNNILNVVSSLGTSLTDSQAKYIRKLTENIVILYDDDKAGQTAKIRAINILNKYGFNIKIMKLDELAKDPDEFLTKYGRDLFVEKYNESLDAIDFLIEYYVDNKDLNQIATKTKIIKDLNEYFSSMKNKIYFENSMKRLANILNIDVNILKENYKFIVNKNYDDKPRNNINNNIKKYNKREELERLSIKYLLITKEQIEIFKKINFENVCLESIINKIYNNSNDYTEEEENIIFDIQTKYDNKIKDKFVLLIRELVLMEINKIDELLSLYGNNINNMSSEKYKKYLELRKEKKSITKSEDLSRILIFFDKYKEYEKGELYVYRSQKDE